jgi:type II secretory pathway component PulC
MARIVLVSWCLVLMVMSVVFNICAEEQYRDPFEPRFPEKPVQVIERPVERKVEKPVKKPTPVSAPQINISGILWNIQDAKAIIDGKVYGVGDTIESVGAKVHKIEKNSVIILYQGVLFEMNIKRKEVGRMEEK